MRKQALKLVAVLAVAAAVVVPTALGGSDLPKITKYTNEKGNMISSKGWGKPVFVNGSKLNQVYGFECYSGKSDGHKTWAEMEYSRISSQVVEVWPSPSCSGFTGPIRGWYSETTAVYGPDFTVTGTPI